MSSSIDSQRSRRDLGLPMYDRVGVSIVGDALEIDIPKPPRRLSGVVGKPMPVIVRVEVGLAVRLDDVAGRDDSVVEAAPMNAAMWADRAVELLGDPRAVPMVRGSV